MAAVDKKYMAVEWGSFLSDTVEHVTNSTEIE